MLSSAYPLHLIQRVLHFLGVLVVVVCPFPQFQELKLFNIQLSIFGLCHRACLNQGLILCLDELGLLVQDFPAEAYSILMLFHLIFDLQNPLGGLKLSLEQPTFAVLDLLCIGLMQKMVWFPGGVCIPG